MIGRKFTKKIYEYNDVATNKKEKKSYIKSDLKRNQKGNFEGERGGRLTQEDKWGRTRIESNSDCELK
jgi:hypothetical protein